jgi:hypothetical protein
VEQACQGWRASPSLAGFDARRQPSGSETGVRHRTCKILDICDLGAAMRWAQSGVQLYPNLNHGARVRDGRCWKDKRPGAEEW